MRSAILSLLLSVPFLAQAQFKNVKIADLPADESFGDPAIVVNKKNPDNIVASFGRDKIFTSSDAGATWNTVTIAPAAGNFDGQVSIVSDGKGTMYAFTVVAGGDQKTRQVICHVSKEKGDAWELIGPVNADASKQQLYPSATVDVKGNIWVAWTQFDEYKSDSENCHSNVMLSHSPNGRKWSKPVQITQTPGNCKDDDNTVAGATPMVAADGRAFVGWTNQQKIFLDRSFDGGGMWLSNDIAVAAVSGGINLKIPGYENCINLPGLAVDISKTILRNSLYAVWADLRSGDDNSDVWISRSSNFGDNWSTPTRIGEDAEKRHQFAPAMATDETSGFIYIVYLDRGEYEDEQTDVLLAYSTDGGGTFKTVKISEAPFSSQEGNNNRNLTQIHAYKGVITPVWKRTENGLSSIWTTTVRQSDLIQVPEASRKKKK